MLGITGSFLGIMIYIPSLDCLVLLSFQHDGEGLKKLFTCVGPSAGKGMISYSGNVYFC